MLFSALRLVITLVLLNFASAYPTVQPITGSIGVAENQLKVMDNQAKTISTLVASLKSMSENAELLIANKAAVPQIQPAKNTKNTVKESLKELADVAEVLYCLANLATPIARIINVRTTIQRAPAAAQQAVNNIRAGDFLSGLLSIAALPDLIKERCENRDLLIMIGHYVLKHQALLLSAALERDKTLLMLLTDAFSTAVWEVAEKHPNELIRGSIGILDATKQFGLELLPRAAAAVCERIVLAMFSSAIHDLSKKPDAEGVAVRFVPRIINIVIARLAGFIAGNALMVKMNGNANMSNEQSGDAVSQLSSKLLAEQFGVPLINQGIAEFEGLLLALAINR